MIDNRNKKRLGDLLVHSGKITMMQLQEALKKQKLLGKKLGQVLIDDKLVTVEDIVDVLEKQTGIKRVVLEERNIDKKAIKAVPQNVCIKHDLIPFGFDKDKIMVAMWDPLNIFASDDVFIACGFQVEPYICTRDEIKKYIDIHYSNEQVLKAAEELSKGKTIEANEANTQNNENIDDVKNAPVVKMVDYLLKNAIELRASDIHIEPYEKIVRIRYRIDGQLKQISTLSVESLAALVTRIKILADLNIAEKRIPQDGRIITKIDNKEVDLRVSTLPMINGEKVVIRILNRDSYQIGKEQLGMEEDDLKKMENIIKSPYGIVLVTGPTGSGKSTTLYTFLNELNEEDKNIITIEDPVEYVMNGINQVNVNVKSGLTFANGLRSILRQDPDVIMIGEIRDNETAEIAIRAAITGHLVLSTLHTNDAPSSIMRLMDMGVEPYLVASSLTGVVAQRLVKKICSKCKKAYEANEYEKMLLGIDKDEKILIYKGEGCSACNNTGFLGRMGVYEIMEITKEHKEKMLTTSNVEELRELALKSGMKTLNMNCRALVIRGETTIDELVKIAYLKD